MSHLKFEVAYLRSLDFEKTAYDQAAKVYARYAGGGIPSHPDYKLLEDYLFYYIAQEAGRLNLVVHIHDFPGVGNYYVAAGSDPLLLELFSTTRICAIQNLCCCMAAARFRNK